MPQPPAIDGAAPAAKSGLDAVTAHPDSSDAAAAVAQVEAAKAARGRTSQRDRDNTQSSENVVVDENELASPDGGRLGITGKKRDSFHKGDGTRIKWGEQPDQLGKGTSGSGSGSVLADPKDGSAAGYSVGD